jgi:hypothetical protein
VGVVPIVNVRVDEVEIVFPAASSALTRQQYEPLAKAVTGAQAVMTVTWLAVTGENEHVAANSTRYWTAPLTARSR